MKKYYFIILMVISFTPWALSSESKDVNCLSQISIQQPSEIEVEVGYGEGFISIRNLPEGKFRFQLLDITGKILKAGILEKGIKENLTTDELKAGVYLLKIEGQHNFKAVRKVYIR